MGRARIRAAVATTAAIAVVIPAVSIAGQGGDDERVKVATKLKGKNEVPGPGDPDGGGRIALFLKAEKQRACLELELEAVDSVVAARVHKGPAGEQGPSKLVLFKDQAGLDGNGSFNGCVKKVKKRLLKSIAANPQDYYVNLFTRSYPEGAVRGQLKARG